MKRIYTLPPNTSCYHQIRMPKTRNVMLAQREGDYGAIARGYGFLIEHCPHCTRDHIAMTCVAPTH